MLDIINTGSLSPLMDEWANSKLTFASVVKYICKQFLNLCANVTVNLSH